MFYTTQYASSIGAVMLASDGENLVGAWNDGQKYFAATIGDDAVRKADLPIFSAVTKWLDAYFAGDRPPIADLPLAPRGSEFRRAVWDILCAIPYGACTTYGDIARTMALDMNKPRMSAQAVGSAVGHNPISIIIPCHRVVGHDGSLTGYAGGLEKKIRLLRHEGADMSRLFAPKKGTAL